MRWTRQCCGIVFDLLVAISKTDETFTTILFATRIARTTVSINELYLSHGWLCRRNSSDKTNRTSVEWIYWHKMECKLLDLAVYDAIPYTRHIKFKFVNASFSLVQEFRNNHPFVLCKKDSIRRTIMIFKFAFLLLWSLITDVSNLSGRGRLVNTYDSRLRY